MKTVAQKIVARDNIHEEIRRHFLHLKIDDIDKLGEELRVLQHAVITAAHHGHQVLPLLEAVLVHTHEEAEKRELDFCQHLFDRVLIAHAGGHRVPVQLLEAGHEHGQVEGAVLRADDHDP